jgi:integrase
MAIYKRGCDKQGPNKACSKCDERGSCGVYWYKFMWQGKLVRESTKQRNDKVARNMESAHRTSLAKGEVGIREKKPVPTLTDFIEKRFEPWAKAQFSPRRKTWLWYRNGLRRLTDFTPLASLPLNEITSESVSGYVARRQSNKLAVSSINRELQVLRRVLNVAVEWGVLDSAIKVKLLTGEARRERVISPDEERRYLAVASEPLGSIAVILVDSGLRPEECFRMRWENINFSTGKYGSVFVTHGKTAAARRMLPLTPRVRSILHNRWEHSNKPDDGWVWPAPTASGHVEPSTLKKQHAKTFKTIADTLKNNYKPVRPFVLYSLRHTFLTRLGESGCDVWTLARIAGHSSITMSSRYVHPGNDAVVDAMLRMGGHKSGHSAEIVISTTETPRLLNQ